MMQTNRRQFIGGMAAAGTVPLFGVPASGRVARVGLVTDTHVGTTMESCARVRAALELFKKKGVEMVVNCGDIQTVPGAPGVLRYVFAFTPPKDGAFPASCKLVFNYVSPGSSFRVVGIRLLRG